MCHLSAHDYVSHCPYLDCVLPVFILSGFLISLSSWISCSSHLMWLYPMIPLHSQAISLLRTPPLLSSYCALFSLLSLQLMVDFAKSGLEKLTAILSAARAFRRGELTMTFQDEEAFIEEVTNALLIHNVMLYPSADVNLALSRMCVLLLHRCCERRRTQ